MAIINCPECGRQISDTSSICPACGYTFPRKKAIRDGAKIKTGAIVNVIGGFGFAATWALLSVFASAENDRSGGVEVSVSTSTFDNPDLAGIVFVVFLASIVVVTAISIAMLFIKKPTSYQETHEEEDDCPFFGAARFRFIGKCSVDRLVQFLDLLWYVALYMGNTSPVYWLCDLHEGCIED